LLSGYVRPNPTLLQKLLSAFPGIPVNSFNQRRWAVDDGMPGLIRFVDAEVSQENKEAKTNQNSKDNFESDLIIKLRGLCG
jgi:hypothetical protein